MVAFFFVAWMSASGSATAVAPNTAEAREATRVELMRSYVRAQAESERLFPEVALAGAAPLAGLGSEPEPGWDRSQASVPHPKGAARHPAGPSSRKR